MVKRSPTVAVTIVVLILISIGVLILIAALPSIQPQKNPTDTAFNQSPAFVLQSPKNNTVIHGTDSITMTLTWENVFDYDYYYSRDAPSIENGIRGNIPQNFIPLNLTITSEKPLPTHWAGRYKTYQCNIQLQNLTDGQHYVTLYYVHDDPILAGLKSISPGPTILFSIDNSTPTQ